MNLKIKETNENTESTEVLNKALQKIVHDLETAIANIRGMPLTGTNETEEEEEEEEQTP